MRFYQICTGESEITVSFFLKTKNAFIMISFYLFLKRSGIDTIWMLGDFFENRKMISTSILNKACQFLESLEKRNIKSFFILGNHDVAFKNTNTVNSLKPITKAYPGIRLIDPFGVAEFDGLPVRFYKLD